MGLRSGRSWDQRGPLLPRAQQAALGIGLTPTTSLVSDQAAVDSR